MVDITTHDVMVAQTEKMQLLIDAFNGKEAQIDAKVAALTGSLEVSYYVDPLNGDDTAVGSDAAPLQSLAEAIGRVPNGFHGSIFLKRTATLEEKVSTRARTLLIRPAAGVTASCRFGWYDGGDGFWYPGSIDFNGVGGAVVFNQLTVNFLNRLAGTRGNAYACGVVTTNTLTPKVFIGFAGSTLYREAGADAFLLASSSNSGDLNISSDTVYGASMDGFWCAGVASGTAASATRYNTNLATL